jgi:hypothetical protein
MSNFISILKKKKNIALTIVLFLLLIGVIGFCLYIVKPQKIEAFSDSDLIDFEKFGSLDDLDLIKTDISSIRQKLVSEYPDLSKYVQKSELPSSSLCRVASAVDKDAYIAKTEASKLDKCPVPFDYDPSKYISKSVALQSQAVSTCPTLNPDQWVLKSSLPPKEIAPPCICPKVKVSAGLCQKCPPPPKCPEVKACPVPECPKPEPCPPQKECPACPPKENCPPKICPACPVPTSSVCSNCNGNVDNIVKVLKKYIYVDQNGKEIKTVNQLIPTPPSSGSSRSSSTQSTQSTQSTSTSTPTPTLNASDRYNSRDDTSRNRDQASSMSPTPSYTPTPSSGLTNPSPTPTFNGSTSTSGSLSEQSNAGGSVFSLFSKPTDKPFVQSYKVDNKNDNKTKSCQSGAFNSEFQQYGIYGDSKNMYNDYLAL